MRTGFRTVWVMIPFACLLLTGCRLDFWHKTAEPKGQVAATVGDQEVTVAEIQAELGGATFADAKTKKAAEQAALVAIIRRKALVQAAKDQKLDRDPQYAVAKMRAEDLVLIQELERKVASGVPTPTRDEVQQYISAHPDTFAERKVLTVDEIQISAPITQQLVEELKKLNTLEEMAAALDRDGIHFVRGNVVIDATSQDPRFIEAILKLQPKDVMLFQDRGILIAGLVRDTKVVPLVGEPAVNFATNLIKQQRQREVLGRTLNGILAKAKGTIKFNPAYAPPKSAPHAAPPAAAH